MTDALTALQPKFALIPSSDVKSPHIPIHIYFQETEDLIAHIQKNNLSQLLIDEGLDPETLQDLPLALVAAREAQTAWTLANERLKPQDQKDLEARGYALRTLVSKKARFSLRTNKGALAILRQILTGEGLPDLVQDLNDLGMLLSHHAALMQRNKNFDTPAAIQEMAIIADSIRKGLSSFRINPEQAKAIHLRNLAWTYLDQLVDDIREAGRAATEGKIARKFSSTYERKMRAQRRTTEPTGPIQPTEPTEEPTPP